MLFVSLITEKIIFAPWNVTLIVWILVLLMYILVHQQLYSLSMNFVICLVLWVFPFTFTSFFVYKITPPYSKPEWVPYEKHVNIITLIALFLVPFAVVKAIQHALILGSPDSLIATLREQAITPEENQLGIVKYFIYVINVLLMIEVNRRNIRKKRLAITIILCILFFVATMAKLTLSIYLFSALYLLYSNKKISLKPIAITILGLVALIPALFLLRGSDSSGEVDIMSILLTYSVASIIAFDYITPASSVLWGGTTFRPLYHILSILGYNYNLPQTLQDFVFVPMITNVYTIMFPFYQDFGKEGVLVFSMILGAILGYIYKKAQTGFTILKYIYAYIFSLLILQFFDELILQGISSILQIVIVLLLCHVKFVFNKKEF